MYLCRTTNRNFVKCWSNLVTKSVKLLQNNNLSSNEASPSTTETIFHVPSMMGRTGFELVHGFTPDASLCVLHEWCDFVWWLDMGDKQEKLGGWLGPCGVQFGGGDCH